MGLMKVESGRDVPHEINVIIEIPMNGDPVKYEVNKDSGVLCVDRFLSTAMYYPVNYGYMPNTLSEDGDPVDVLVVAPLPLLSGSVIACRPVGMLKMTDDSGIDTKILAVPVPKLTKMYNHVKTYEDLPETTLESLEHFFNHYKDLEDGKWVKIDGWRGIEDAKQAIVESIERYKTTA